MRHPFITYRETDKNGILQYYILQRAFPHYIGLMATRPIEGSICQMPVAGYRLYVTFDGTLMGNFIPAFKDSLQEVTAVMDEMAVWYAGNRIVENEKRYERFKIKSNDNVAGK